MTVIPLRTRSPVADASSIALRIDLRTKLTTAAVVDIELRTEADLDLARSACVRVTTLTRNLTIALRPVESLYADAVRAGELAAMIVDAGFEPSNVDLELDETSLAATSLGGAERLRARGFGLSLRLAPNCPLPLGARDRTLFSEFLTPAPTRIDPFLGCDGWQDHPLASRIFAAKAAFIAVTALGVHDVVMARALVAAGFDRGEGAYAGFA